MHLAHQNSFSESHLNYTESENYSIHNETISHLKEELHRITGENVYLKAYLKYHSEATARKMIFFEKELATVSAQNKQLLENNVSLEMELRTLKSSISFDKMQMEPIKKLHNTNSFDSNKQRLKNENKKLFESLNYHQVLLKTLKDTNVALQQELGKQRKQNKKLLGLNETLELQIQNLKKQVGSLLKVMKTDANTDLTIDELLMELKPNGSNVKTFKITKQFSSKVSVMKLEDIVEDQLCENV